MSPCIIQKAIPRTHKRMTMKKTKYVPVALPTGSLNGSMFPWVYAQNVMTEGLVHPARLLPQMIERPSWNGLDCPPETSGNYSWLAGSTMRREALSKEQLWKTLNKQERKFFSELHETFNSRLDYASLKEPDK